MWDIKPASAAHNDEGDVLDWEEGNEGKGLIARDGHVYTWNTDDYDVHQQWLARHPEVMPMKYIEIAEDGRCTGTTFSPLDGQDEEVLRDADPRLYVVVDEESTWNFG